MEHAKIDDQTFSPLSTATGGGTVELPTTGAQLQAPPSPRTTSAQCPLPCLQLATRKYRARGQNCGGDYFINIALCACS